MPLKDKAQRLAYQRAYYHRTKAQRYERDEPKRKINRRRSYERKWVWYLELKSQLVCKRCGEDHPACMVFHHSDPTRKEITIAEAAMRWSRERLVQEIAKCEVLCANCHIKLHLAERKR
jgi:hypothetical protein